MLWGSLWGVGGLTFGLAVRYLGITLGYAIALGLSSVFGTLIPLLYSGETNAIIHEHSGRLPCRTARMIIRIKKRYFNIRAREGQLNGGWKVRSRLSLRNEGVARMSNIHVGQAHKATRFPASNVSIQSGQAAVPQFNTFWQSFGNQA